MAVERYAANQHATAMRQKRGGDARFEPVEDQAVATESPEQLFEREVTIRTSRKIVWRQFHSEGMVNEYVLESVSADGKSMEFITRKIESLPTGFRARKVYRIVSQQEIVETFWLAPPGKDLELYAEARLNRE